MKLNEETKDKIFYVTWLLVFVLGIILHILCKEFGVILIAVGMFFWGYFNRILSECGKKHEWENLSEKEKEEAVSFGIKLWNEDINSKKKQPKKRLLEEVG